MELVAADFGADGIVGIFALDGDDRVPVSLGPFEQAERQGEHPGHAKTPAFYHELVAQVHEPSAFGINGQAVVHQAAEASAEFFVLGQFLGMGFGKTAADVKRIDLRKPPVVQGADKKELGARGFEGFDIFGVIKLKRGILENTDAANGRLDRCPLARWPV